MAEDTKNTATTLASKLAPNRLMGSTSNRFRAKREGPVRDWSKIPKQLRPFLGVGVGLFVLLLVGGGVLPHGVTGTHLVLFLLVLAAGASRASLGGPSVSRIEDDGEDGTATVSWFDRTADADLVVLPLSAVLLAQQAMVRDGHLIFPLSLFVLAWATINHSKFSTRVALGYVIVGQLACFSARGAWNGALPLLFAQLSFASLFALSSRLVPRLPETFGRRQPSSRPDVSGKERFTELSIDEQARLKSVDLRSRLSTLEAGLEAMLDLARGSTESHSVVFMTRVDDGKFRVFVGSSPEPLVPDIRTAEAGLLADALKSFQDTKAENVLRVHPLDGAATPLPYMERTPARIRSVMTVLVQRDDGVLDGVLFFDRTVGPGYDKRDAQRAQRTAQLVSRLLETEREVHAVSRQTAHIDHLLGIAELLSDTTITDESWDTFLRAAAAIAPLRFGGLLLRDGAGNAARVVSALGEGSGSCRHVHVELSSSFVGLSFQDDIERPKTVEWSVETEGGLFGGHGGPELDAGDLVHLIPLRARGLVLGVMVLVADRALEDDENAALRLLSVQATETAVYVQLVRDMERRTLKDDLTGLDSREIILGKLEQSVARSQRSDSEVCGLLIDVDHLQRVNDTHGMHVGDELLRKIAQILDECRRINDSVGRVGGDEFLLVLEDASDDGGRLVAERIRTRVQRLVVDAAGQGIGTTLSMGMAVVPTDAKKGVELLKLTDKALYRAKKQGRDRLVGVRDPKAPPVLAQIKPVKS